MKELSTEEKAQRYDEVRKKIALRFGSNVADEIFSQFEMSEDERIRKELIKETKGSDERLFEIVTNEEFIAWLEKQGEQKPTDEEMYKEVLTDIIYAKNDLEEKECLELSKRAMKAFNWFSKRYKSLRPQTTWKPSDEQMKILNEVLNFAANHESSHWNDYIFGTLNNLIRQLKKLREE